MKYEIEQWPSAREIAWRVNGKLHNDLGPAFITSDGNQFWYRNGSLHRVDGPACIYPCLSYSPKYYILGVNIGKEKFHKFTKIKKVISGLVVVHKDTYKEYRVFQSGDAYAEDLSAE